MEENKAYASSCEIKQIAIYKVKEETKAYANLSAMAVSFQYHEDIFWPSYGATLVLLDNGENLISSMPIQGGEKVVIEVEDVHKELYSWTFRVHHISNRITRDRRQTYTLCLISSEGLLNESVCITKCLEGKSSDIVKKICTEYLQVPSGRVAVEESMNQEHVEVNKQHPFTAIKNLLAKSFSKPRVKKKFKFGFGERDAGKLKTAGFSTVSEAITDPDFQKSTGSAGYLFFQTNEGYHFVSFDALAEQEVSGLFTYSPGKVADNSTNKIQELQFNQDLDMIKKLREGAYSSNVCFFNINTGKYEEYVYSLNDVWNDMVHLGASTNLPYGQAQLANLRSPTRVMSTIIDNESNYMGEEVAFLAQDHPYKDWQKNSFAQSIARAGIMFNQTATIALDGHLELSAGDIVDIRVPNQLPDAKRDQDIWDQEQSGKYLVKNLNHQIDTRGQTVYTVLELIRDSYGITESKIT